MDTPKKIGRYEILEELGHGAMGTVYRAKDPAMDRVVALKTIISLVLVSEQGSEFRERFFREARAAGGLSHPGIVTVFDVGEHDGLPFLVMEFISGKTLADEVKHGERLTIDRVCEIGQKIAEALGYAHQRGVVHRDIKPANILLTSREAHGIERPKITDFGVAKLAQGHTTMTGQILGTPAFMPPEQFTGAPIDGRADIFSLGVVLYWMATGEQPFPGESLTAVSYKVVHTEPIPPRKLNPSIPQALENIILKCLSKSPEERYQTGEELAHELGELRVGSTATGLLSTASRIAASGSDPDATLVETFPVSPTESQARPPMAKQEPTVVPAPKHKSNGRYVLAAAVIAVLVTAGWYLLRTRQQPVAQISVTPVAMSEAPSAEVSTRTPTKIPSEAKAVVSVPKKPEKDALPENTPEPPKQTIPPPLPAAVDFNPRSLDPKENAKLKIEADHIPFGFDFTVEMNGKIYLQSNGGGNKTQFDDLFVPPGVQEFRVTSGSGETQKTSNIVSTEFKAKKRHTLKIEVRSHATASGAAITEGQSADSQIFVTLK